MSNCRAIFMGEKMYEAFIVYQVVVAKLLNCAMECDWSIVLFFSFSSAKPSANITRRLTEFTGKQRCNAWTGTHILFCFVCDQEVATAGKVAKSVVGGQMFHFSRQQATGLSVKRGCTVFTVDSTSICATACLRVSFGRPNFISCRLGVVDRSPAGDMSPISEPVTRAFRHILRLTETSQAWHLLRLPV